jgi:ATP-dependent Clp protease ATP-binding subunit ClpC
MFERYTEKARRVIFFARYEASQFGASQIEAEHMLLGLIREDKSLTNRFLHRAQVNIDLIRKEIEGRTVLRDRVSSTIDLPLSGEAKRVLAFAAEESTRLGHRHIGTEHLLLGLLREENSVAAEILYERGIRLSDVRQELMRQSPQERSGTRRETPHLTEFCRDLTEAALEGKLDPLIGRQEELDRVMQILCRRTKNNPVLIGEPGVGKTAIVEGLAYRIVQGEVPVFLAEKRVLALDLGLVVAGTKYRGQFEERMKTIMRELGENPHYIVFIDELHTLVGAGSAEGSLDAANILKPALSRGDLQCIGASTPVEFRKTIEKDRSLERRFQAVRVAAPSEEETMLILEGLRDQYESFHQVRYANEAIEAAVHQSSRYLPDRHLPDKAIDVLDEAGAQVKLRQQKGRTGPRRLSREERRMAEEENRRSSVAWYAPSSGEATERPLELAPESEIVPVVKHDIDEVIARWTGIPITTVHQEESARLLRIEDDLRLRIVRQEAAISALARAIRRSRAGLRTPQRPVGSFLFLGPTGVGKTEVARSLATHLFGSERALIRFDMSEFMEKHSVSKLIGSPPGYVGYEEGGQLTERVRRNPYSILLLDEIEKAHPDIFNLLLQVFEDGILTDALGNTADFRHALIIMTSNIGARFIQQGQKGGPLGFQASREEAMHWSGDRVRMAVQETFNPEFINRLDEIIVFEPLSDEDLFTIAIRLTDQLNQTLQSHGLQLRLTEEAARWIVDQTCTDRSYGARPLRRAIQKYIEDPLSDALLAGRFNGVARIEVRLDGGELQYCAVARDEQPQPEEALIG